MEVEGVGALRSPILHPAGGVAQRIKNHGTGNLGRLPGQDCGCLGVSGHPYGGWGAPRESERNYSAHFSGGGRKLVSHFHVLPTTHLAGIQIGTLAPCSPTFCLPPSVPAKLALQFVLLRASPYPFLNDI